MHCHLEQDSSKMSEGLLQNIRRSLSELTTDSPGAAGNMLAVALNVTCIIGVLHSMPLGFRLGK